MLALLDGSADVAELFVTDGQIAEYDLIVLEDDQSFFPVYEPAPLVRSDALADIPRVSRRRWTSSVVRSVRPTCRP